MGPDSRPNRSLPDVSLHIAWVSCSVNPPGASVERGRDEKELKTELLPPGAETQGDGQANDMEIPVLEVLLGGMGRGGTPEN